MRKQTKEIIIAFLVIVGFVTLMICLVEWAKNNHTSEIQYSVYELSEFEGELYHMIEEKLNSSPDDSYEIDLSMTGNIFQLTIRQVKDE